VFFSIFVAVATSYYMLQILRGYAYWCKPTACVRHATSHTTVSEHYCIALLLTHALCLEPSCTSLMGKLTSKFKLCRHDFHVVHYESLKHAKYDKCGHTYSSLLVEFKCGLIVHLFLFPKGWLEASVSLHLVGHVLLTLKKVMIMQANSIA
jgi:hypothetical protein